MNKQKNIKKDISTTYLNDDSSHIYKLFIKENSTGGLWIGVKNMNSNLINLINVKEYKNDVDKIKKNIYMDNFINKHLFN